MQRYYDSAGPITDHSTVLKHVDTPFLVEDHKQSDAGKPTFIEGPHVSCPWCHVAIPIPSNTAEDDTTMDGCPQCAACLSSAHRDEILPSTGGGPACRAQTLSEAELVERATESLNSDLKLALKGKASKSKKKAKPAEDNGDRGKLWSIAARVLMKLLCSARMARYDLLRPVCHLACHVAKWNSECDRRLHKLVCYVNSTLHLRMIGWAGDKLEDVQPHIYADADFTGCTASQKFTNGVHHVLRGPNTCFPIEGVSKRQSCVSTSTTEAEIVAGFFALKTVGLPELAMWAHILPLLLHLLSTRTTKP